ncbi:FadR/GntR family transcriptional regulator [Brachybacterium hainanense]|uniref:FadR/GntR family transcriptional regulator n=1 Tax=Brachybacterium hainanense TaxID=1541174 RepID=A0ABV6R8G4_9MICO
MNASPAADPPGRPRSNQERLQDAIKQLILSRQLHPGDILPTESELMALLGTSRNPLREAMKALQALGFVEIRHGHGTYAGSLPLSPLQDFLSFRLRRSIGTDLREVGDLLQLREALEVGMASDVVRTHLAHGTEELRGIVGQMEAKAAAGEYFPDEDLAFHGALYRPLGNTLILELLEVFWNTFHLIDAELPGPHYTPAEACAWHAGLLAALERGDADQYRWRMREHFDGIRIRISRADHGPAEAPGP